MSYTANTVLHQKKIFTFELSVEAVRTVPVSRKPEREPVSAQYAALAKFTHPSSLFF